MELQHFVLSMMWLMFSFTESRENPSYKNEDDFLINKVLQGPSGTTLRNKIFFGIGVRGKVCCNLNEHIFKACLIL